jgi:hypothetical protein
LTLLNLIKVYTSSNSVLAGIQPLLGKFTKLNFYSTTLTAVSTFDWDFIASNICDFYMSKLAFFVWSQEENLMFLDKSFDNCPSENDII